VTPEAVSAAADSLTHAAALARTEWIEFATSWHEFFLMAGTAAVTLAGLLFVAISIHVDALIHESRQHLLSFARLILFSYVGVLVLSLVMLVPAFSMKFTALQLIVVSIPLLAWTLRLSLGQRGDEHPEFSRALLMRRAGLSLVGYGFMAVTGIMMMRTRRPEFLFWVVGAVSMLLGNATGASWDLLVRTARIRRHAEKAGEAKP
jgi:hypothetical protein